MCRTAILLLLLGSPVAAMGQSVAGTATVIDGDTIRVNGQAIRLFGIDAPEADQTCDREGVSWECGKAATQQLANLVEGRTVECTVQSMDSYGRSVGICTIGYTEINRTMVEHGWAVAYRTYSSAYVPEEIRAKAARSGIWSSTFDLPEFHRVRQRSSAGETADRTRQGRAGNTTGPKTRAHDGSCTIKGNRNRKGQWIYHLPGMPYYDATRPEEIFCSEAAAQRAGYRRAIVR